MPMKKKNWALLALAALLCAYALLSAVVILVDPFQVYRKAERFLPPIDNTSQVYANAGIVRQYDYDSVIVGTSVCENFRPSQADALLGGRFIKLVTQAGTAYNHALLMKLAFDTHDVRRVIYGLDVYSFIAETDETGSAVPLYLYDRNPFNDVQYWLNRSVLGAFLPRCLRTWGQRQDDSIRDSMYNWIGRDEYGPVAMYGVAFDEPETVYPMDYHTARALENLETHLLPYIKAHPDTQFDIFFPPYSAAEWSSMKSKGTLDSMLNLRSVCYHALSAYDNVAVYDFAVCEDWVKNIDNYKDTLHYGVWINDAIIAAIADGRHAVAEATQIEEGSARLRQWAEELFAAKAWIY